VCSFIGECRAGHADNGQKCMQHWPKAAVLIGRAPEFQHPWHTAESHSFLPRHPTRYHMAHHPPLLPSTLQQRLPYLLAATSIHPTNRRQHVSHICAIRLHTANTTETPYYLAIAVYVYVLPVIGLYAPLRRPNQAGTILMTS